MDELVRRVVVVDDAAHVSRAGLEYDLVRQTERLDADGRVIAAKTVRAVAHPSRQIAYAIDLAPDANASAEERARAEREAKEGERMQAVMRLRRLADHFRYAIEGRETVDGRDCWVLAFVPRPGAPAATREERIVNQLTGRFWIDRTTEAIVRSEGNLPAPVSIALVASMNVLRFQYRSQPLPSGDLAPRSFELEVDVSAPFYRFRQRQRSTMSNYRSP